MTDEALLEQLHPLARPPVILWRDRCGDELGLALDLFDAWRDGAAQDAAFASGTTTKKAGGSYHNLSFPDGTPCSLAIHGRVRTAKGRSIGFDDLPLEYAGAARARLAAWWNDGTEAQVTPREVLLAAVAMIAEECSLKTGARWRHLQDWCHVEKHVPGATLEQIKAGLAASGKIVDVRA